VPDVPTYTAAMGEVRYDPPRTVIVAGKPRTGIAYCSPRVEEAWAATDAIDEANEEYAKEFAKIPNPLAWKREGDR
jgi:hypothetical protein